MRFGHLPNPVINANRCICGFDGKAWAKEESEAYRSCHYLAIAKGDMLVEIRCDPDIAEGWGWVAPWAPMALPGGIPQHTSGPSMTGSFGGVLGR